MGTEGRNNGRLSNGRYWIVERITAALIAALLLVGCAQGETDMEREALPSSQAPAPAAEQPAVRPDTGADVPSADDGAENPAGRTGDEAAVSGDPGRSASGGGGSDGGAIPPRSSPQSQPQSPQSAPASQQASPETILRATSRAYEGLRSFRATFEQTLQNTLLGRTTRSEGVLYQKQPDRFLMAFTTPENDRIVSDGRYFWMYFPSVDEKQVIRTARGAQGLDLHSQFIGDPVRRFETTYHGTEPVGGRQAHVMTLVPREALGYQRLKVWIDASDHLVRRFELTENNGNVRHFVLSDLEKNPSLPDDLFDFTPPPGTQVVER